MRPIVRRPVPLLPLSLGLCLTLAIGAAPAAAQDDEPRVVIRKIENACQGEGCEDREHVVIELDGGERLFGDFTALLPTLGGFELLSGGEEGRNLFLFRGRGGGYLGVQLVGLTEALRTHFGVPAGQGVMVSEVADDTAAWRAGLQAGDIVTAVDDETVSTSSELARKIRAVEPGGSVDLEVWREGRPQTLTAQIDQREPEPRARAIFLNCEDGEDCNQIQVRGLDVGCEGESCSLEVNCEDGDCTCTVNGEARDCESLDQFRWNDRRHFRFRHQQQ